MNNGPKLIQLKALCVVLREEGVQEAGRIYWARRTKLPALRAVEDTKVIDTLRGLNKLDAKERPRPEIFYGRRKMSVWLRRNGFPEVSAPGLMQSRG